MVLAPVCVYLCVLAMLLFTHHHQCGNPSHIFELHARGKAQVYLSHLLLAKGGDCKLLPSPWPTSPKSTHPRLQTFARRLASVCLSCPFFRLRPCSASTGAVVWWGWHPRSLLTERRMVVHPGAGSFPTPPPPTRPPHGPDAASRPSCINNPKRNCDTCFDHQLLSWSIMSTGLGKLGLEPVTSI